MKEMKEKVKEPSKSVLKNLRESILIILEISLTKMFFSKLCKLVMLSSNIHRKF